MGCANSKEHDFSNIHKETSAMKAGEEPLLMWLGNAKHLPASATFKISGDFLKEACATTNHPLPLRP